MIHGLVVTYEREELLLQTCTRLASQTRALDTLVVVDNSGRALPDATVRTLRATSYIYSGNNLGPAGGIALGMRAILDYAADDDWLLLIDDDNPPATTDLLERLARFAELRVDLDPMTAGVALVGSPFDRRRGRILRLSDDELQGDVAVDCFGGGHMPLYRVGAVRKVGSFEERLFFGYEELEYGLRLRSQGFHLYVNGALLLEQRSHWGRLGMGRAPSSAPLPPWREFYSRRNLLWILRRNGCRRAAARQTMVILGRMVVNVVSTRGNDRVRVRLLARALRDGWTGHLGRTVEPLAKY